MHGLSISLLIEFSSKTIGQNPIKNRFTQYLCFIIVDFIQSCHHHLEITSFSLKKNKFRSIDLTCWRSTQTLHLQFLKALNKSSWKDFWSNGNSKHFENSPSFQISWTWSDVFWINENFIQQQSAMFNIAEMAKIASLVTKL